MYHNLTTSTYLHCIVRSRYPVSASWSRNSIGCDGLLREVWGELILCVLPLGVSYVLCSGQVFWSWQSTASPLQGQTSSKAKDWCSSTQCWQTQSKQEGCGKGNCQVHTNNMCWMSYCYIVCVPELFMLVWRHQRKWMLCCMSLMWWLMPPGPLLMTSESSPRTRTWRFLSHLTHNACDTHTLTYICLPKTLYHL